MATEPVNERPIFPALLQVSALGIGQWSTSMVRQLTTVFQQYGYRLNKALLDEDLDTNGGDIVTDGGDSVLRDSDLEQNSGTIPEIDQAATWTGVQTFTPAQIFSAAPVATGNPLRFDELAEEGGSIPETDRVNNFTTMQQVNGEDLFVTGSNANGDWIELHGGWMIAEMEITDNILNADWTNIVGPDGNPTLVFANFPQFTFPKAFTSPPSIAVNIDGHWVWYRFDGGSPVTTTTCDIDLIRESAPPTGDFTVKIVATGRV